MPPRNVLNKNSALSNLLSNLKPGEEASVLTDIQHIGNNGKPQVDADLYRRSENGDIQRIDHVHLNQNNLKEQK